MKKILFIGLLVLLMTSFSYAGDNCREIGALAETIMTKRQAGVDITTMLDIVENQDVPEEIKKVSKSLVINAYDFSEYSTQEYKEKAIRKFKTIVMVECYK